MSLTSHTLWLVASGIFVVNLPFGYWRAGLRKLSAKWFVAIHAPVPVAVALRLIVGVPLRLVTFPVLVAAYFAGQQCGAAVRHRRLRARSRSPSP